MRTPAGARPARRGSTGASRWWRSSARGCSRRWSRSAASAGWRSVTVAHVVARSGVSRRTFYELFEDREDCFLAAFDHALGRASAVVVPAYEPQKAWRERIRAGLAALLGFLDDEPGLGALLRRGRPRRGAARAGAPRARARRADRRGRRGARRRQRARQRVPDAADGGGRRRGGVQRDPRAPARTAGRRGRGERALRGRDRCAGWFAESLDEPGRRALSRRERRPARARSSPPRAPRAPALQSESPARGSTCA